jgi:hypothetical protein
MMMNMLETSIFAMTCQPLPDDQAPGPEEWFEEEGLPTPTVVAAIDDFDEFEDDDFDDFDDEFDDDFEEELEDEYTLDEDEFGDEFDDGGGDSDDKTNLDEDTDDAAAPDKDDEEDGVEDDGDFEDFGEET